MAEVGKTGTVTPLNSLFTSEEAEKAARVVDDAIAERHKEFHRISDFFADNSALIHHVQKLPDELTHDIMVPFGGAAFFPGRLIHTNEFMVLLGEGYYAERSAKQTVEILQRRGNSLEAHLESLKRIIKDLDAEANFFESTAAEVAEGLVEIREEYVEKIQSKKPGKGVSSTSFAIPSKVRNSVVPDEKNEDDKIMARLDELEKEEEEAASDLGQDEDYETNSSSHIDEDEDEEDEEEEDDEDEDANDNAEDVSDTDDEVLGSKVQVSPRGLSESIVMQPYVNPPSRLEANEYPPKSPNPNSLNSSERSSSQISNTSSTESMAFTGTVIEHSHGLGSTTDSTSTQSSRPVSRFKMQRGNR